MELGVCEIPLDLFPPGTPESDEEVTVSVKALAWHSLAWRSPHACRPDAFSVCKYSLPPTFILRRGFHIRTHIVKVLEDALNEDR